MSSIPRVEARPARNAAMRKPKAPRSLNRPIIDRLARVIARGQAAGAFRNDVDAVETHKAIAALGMFNITNQYPFGSIFQTGRGPRGDIDRRCAVVADIVL